MTRFFLDYIQDYVASRLVNVLVLVAALGPLFHFMYIVQAQLDVHYPPLFYMLCWFIFPSLFCLLVLVPLQIGNNSFDETLPTIISIIWCLILFGYESYACYILIQFYEIPWFYVICLLASSVSSIIAAIYYLYMLLTKSSYITYAQETADQYQDIIPNDEEVTDNENPEILESINHSYLALLLQFFWPSIPEMNGNYTIFYPSRVIVTVFLTLSGVIGTNQILLYYYIWSGEQLEILLNYVDTLDSIDFESDRKIQLLDRDGAVIENIESAISWSVAIGNKIYFICKPISDALLFGSIIGLIFGIFGSVMILRTWKQRMVCMRHGYGVDGKKLSNLDINDYPIWWSAKFISSVGCSVVFGSAMVAILCAIIFGLATHIDVWSLLIESGVWRYILCYLIYYIFELIIFQWLLIKIWFKNKMDHKYVSLIMIINDLTYMPLAALFCIIRILQITIIGLISFIRPDLSVFPGYLATMDHGHLSFVSSIRLAVEKEKNYVSHSVDNENNDNIEIQKRLKNDNQ